MEQQKILSPGQPQRPRLTAGFVRTRFADLANGVAPAQRGDHDLNPGVRPGGKLKQAAVLVPLIDHADGLSVLLTQRTAHLAAHAGQISFPGGGMEPEDADAVAAALRETEEEIGLARDRIEILGRLDLYVTGTGFEVTPVVGLIRPPFPVTPDPFEVAEIFEVPLDFLVDPANRERHSREFNGRTRHFYALPYRERFIWGATAGMLVNLAHVLE
jgi:8-oxo-dGTP pyrophosphatase MutT (NUDIX family)